MSAVRSERGPRNIFEFQDKEARKEEMVRRLDEFETVMREAHPNMEEAGIQKLAAAALSFDLFSDVIVLFYEPLVDDEKVSRNEGQQA